MFWDPVCHSLNRKLINGEVGEGGGKERYTQTCSYIHEIGDDIFKVILLNYYLKVIPM